MPPRETRVWWRVGCAVQGRLCCVFFFNVTATTEIYTLSLHDALPILQMHDIESIKR